MSRRGRRSTVDNQPSVAHEHPAGHPKTVELENRVARLELLVEELLRVMEEQQRAHAALNAELTHLIARLGIIR